ncbi:acylphosphatase [Agarivorans sp. MS3-6]|uniref:acylphosphatase n=1 Tax=Agarivorans sp. TSD2052 TaxID=2937286 RepID=UPI00200E929B|nr:acylphosphatase [Agarivorans sp. TSD2052]UPW20422.1 acylphosphatase [Agarivorans sp. TSD2052]
MSLIRLTVLAKGKVQGVGYRYHIMLKANQLSITGYAKNLSDGDVEIVAEGNETDVMVLMGFLQTASPSSVVEDIVTEELIKLDTLTFSQFNSY